MQVSSHGALAGQGRPHNSHAGQRQEHHHLQRPLRLCMLEDKTLTMTGEAEAEKEAEQAMNPSVLLESALDREVSSLWSIHDPCVSSIIPDLNGPPDLT